MTEDEVKPSQVRYLILVVAAAHLTFLQGSAIAFNASYVAMAQLATSPLYVSSLSSSGTSVTSSASDDVIEEERNVSSSFSTSPSIDWSSHELPPLADRRYVFTPFEKSLLFAGLYLGSIIGTQPIGWLVRRVGARWSMTANGIISILLTVSLPYVVAFSFPLFVVWRLLAGATFSMLFPVAGIVVASWAPQTQRGLFVGVLCAHLELAALFTMPMSGIIAQAVSWPAVYYMHAAIVAVTTALWVILYRDDPRDHAMISSCELALIQEGKGDVVSARQRPEPPYRRIFSTRSLWACFAAVLGTYFPAQFSITFAPSYISYVLGFSAAAAGALTVIPLLLQAIFKFAAGWLSDRLTMIDETLKVRCFNSAGLFLSALFFVLIAVVPFGAAVALDLALIILAVACLGLHAGGFPKCVVLVTREHSAFVMSIVQMLAGVAMATGSLVVPSLTAHLSDVDEWRRVFLLYALSLLFGNTLFVLFADADAAEWTEQEKERRKKKEEEHGGAFHNISLRSNGSRCP